MSAEDLEKYETEMELSLYREYKDIVGQFSYVVETERRFYLANSVELVPRNTEGEVYFDLISLWHGLELVVGAPGQSRIANNASRWPDDLALPEFMMYVDSQTYLPDDILTKVGRATMGVSLESRAPFLDHRVVELAATLPLDCKLREGQGKWILRQILYKHVPRDLIERPKMGFAIPIDSWLRGPLRDWAESLIGEARLRGEGYLDPEPIRKKWTEHLSGRRNWQNELWGVLMFQAWRERWL